MAGALVREPPEVVLVGRAVAFEALARGLVAFWTRYRYTLALAGFGCSLSLCHPILEQKCQG